MFWLSMIDGILPIGDIIYLGGILATSVVDFISAIGVGNAVKYQSGAAFKQELSKAIAYYAKCATKQFLSIIYSILKASIPSVIKEGASIIDEIFHVYGIGES